MNTSTVKTSRIGKIFKDGAKVLLGTCVLFLLLEIIFRLGAFFYLKDGKYYLLYGLPALAGRVGASPWSTHSGGYYKFPPHSVIRGASGQGEGTASINSHGFRGPDFLAAKPKGVFRIICLGGSSTFGFRDSDVGTYPFLLQKLLRKEGLKVEVINAGFPYYNTGSIVSLLKEELLNYKPDLITLYAAYNDTSWPLSVDFLGKTVLWIQAESVAFLLTSDYLSQSPSMAKLRRRLPEKIIPQKFPRAELEEQLAPLAQRYRENVQAIVRSAKERQIPVVLIKQPMTTDNDKYASVSYEEEYRSIMNKLENGERLTAAQVWMVKHHRLLEELEKIAQEEKLPMVNNIQIVDRDRRRLASWVHLTEEANQRLAEALAVVIKPYIFREPAPSSPR